MDIQLVILAAVVSAAVATGIGGVAVLSKAFGNRGTRKRLEDVSADEIIQDGVAQVILRDMDASSLPLLNWLVDRFPALRAIDALLVQADVSMRLAPFLGVMFLAGGVLGLAAWNISGFWWAGLGAFAVGAVVPVFVLSHKKRRRVAAFEKQFADALDILTGALRAGLAFSGAIQVVAEETPEPVSREFSIVFEENRLGLDMKEALRKLADRIDCAELRMFVTAVILQRETGGNLAEILESTAHIIRERFRILGEVRAMTAQQRFSGLILTLLPLGMAALFTVMAPDYMRALITDPVGPYIIGGALAMQVIGYLIIRKIVDIKV
jgi:tight adherence protein B